MREKRYLTNRCKYYSILLTLIIISSIFMTFTVCADENQLIIDAEEEVFEGNNFLISVYTINENEYPEYQVDVEINFNNKSYNITSEDWQLNIIAPEVVEKTFFNITASKIGYKSAILNISVLNIEKQDLQRLIITLLDTDFIIEASNQFSVLITNETGNPITNVTVGIQSYVGKGSIGETDNNGRVCLIAPADSNEIILIAQKEGYIDGTEKIWVNIVASPLEKILFNPYMPIVAAVIILIIAILFVNLKHKRTIELKAQNINSFKKNANSDNHYQKIVTLSGSKKGKNIKQKESKLEKKDDSGHGTKVEEIRISRNSNKRKIVKVEDEEKNKVNSKTNGKKNGKNWFEGTKDIRYEIDKITGKIDEKGKDRWFEGTDNIRIKIDEKLKEKDKNKGK